MKTNKITKTIIGLLAGFMLLSISVTAQAVLVSEGVDNSYELLGGVRYFNFNNLNIHEILIGSYNLDTDGNSNSYNIPTNANKGWGATNLLEFSYTSSVNSLSTIGVTGLGSVPFNVSRSFTDWSTSPVNYMQINVTGNSSGAVTLDDVLLNGNSLSTTSFFSNEALKTWYLTGDDLFNNGIINLTGNIVLDGVQSASNKIEILLGYKATPVPIPSAVWLLGSGLIGIVAVRRRFSK